MRQIPVTCAHLHAVFSPPVRSESSARHQYHTTTRVRHGSVASSLHSLTIPLLSPAAVANCLSIRWSRSVFFRGVLCVVWLIVVAIIRSFVVRSFVHHSFVRSSFVHRSFDRASFFPHTVTLSLLLSLSLSLPAEQQQSSTHSAAVTHRHRLPHSPTYSLTHSLTHTLPVRSVTPPHSLTAQSPPHSHRKQPLRHSQSAFLPSTFHCSTVPKVGIPIYKRYSTALSSNSSNEGIP